MPFPFELCAASRARSEDGKCIRCHPRVCCEVRPEQTELVVHRTIPGVSVFAEAAEAATLGTGVDEVLSHHVLDCLQGSWYRQADGMHVGAVSGSFLEVSASWLPHVTTCRLPQNITDTLKLSVDGESIYGCIRLEAQYSITWSNGDVWLKK